MEEIEEKQKEKQFLHRKKALNSQKKPLNRTIFNVINRIVSFYLVFAFSS